MWFLFKRRKQIKRTENPNEWKAFDEWVLYLKLIKK
uniref:Uncharacterized protein n=1 Tax=viral metagenome TaxID=1070528 RepID=A0A6C0BR93_9ZZZZ